MTTTMTASDRLAQSDMDTRLIELRAAHDALTARLAVLDKEIAVWQPVVHDARRLLDAARQERISTSPMRVSGIMTLTTDGTTSPASGPVYYDQGSIQREGARREDVAKRAAEAEATFADADREAVRAIRELVNREAEYSRLSDRLSYVVDQIGGTQTQIVQLTEQANARAGRLGRLRARLAS